MKQIEVQIMGQSYLLGCPEGGEARLRDAVERVDLTMCRIRDAGKVRARDRIAVLASLHLAYDLGQQLATTEASAAAAAATQAAAQAQARLEAEVTARAQVEAQARRLARLAQPPGSVLAQDRLDELVKRLDQALAERPHLP